MEKIILGLLMISGRTIYEMKSILSTKLDSMCSNSSGSIHTAIKKLIEQNYITWQEIGRKKIYSITSAGKVNFMQWIAQPMQADKQKNMELSKLFFGGLVSPQYRGGLIDAHISNLKEQKEIVEKLIHVSNISEDKMSETTTLLFSGDLWNTDGIISLSTDRNPYDIASDLYQYQMATLKHALDYFQFEIKWYETFKKGISYE